MNQETLNQSWSRLDSLLTNFSCLTLRSISCHSNILSGVSSNSSGSSGSGASSRSQLPNRAPPGSSTPLRQQGSSKDRNSFAEASSQLEPNASPSAGAANLSYESNSSASQAQPGLGGPAFQRESTPIGQRAANGQGGMMDQSVSMDPSNSSLGSALDRFPLPPQNWSRCLSVRWWLSRSLSLFWRSTCYSSMDFYFCFIPSLLSLPFIKFILFLLHYKRVWFDWCLCSLDHFESRMLNIISTLWSCFSPLLTWQREYSNFNWLLSWHHRSIDRYSKQDQVGQKKIAQSRVLMWESGSLAVFTTSSKVFESLLNGFLLAPLWNFQLQIEILKERQGSFQIKMALRER